MILTWTLLIIIGTTPIAQIRGIVDYKYCVIDGDSLVPHWRGSAYYICRPDA